LGDPTEGVAEYARDRVTCLPVQLAVAVRMLRRYASLTPLGAALLDELTVHVEKINADALAASEARDDVQAFVITDEGACVPHTDASGAPMTVAAVLREHASRHPAGDQCAAVVDDLWPFAKERAGS
jgi:hypothetical protein